MQKFVPLRYDFYYTGGSSNVITDSSSSSVHGGGVISPFFKNLLPTFILPSFYKAAYTPAFTDVSEIYRFLL